MPSALRGLALVPLVALSLLLSPVLPTFGAHNDDHWTRLRPFSIWNSNPERPGIRIRTTNREQIVLEMVKPDGSTYQVGIVYADRDGAVGLANNVRLRNYPGSGEPYWELIDPSRPASTFILDSRGWLNYYYADAWTHEPFNSGVSDPPRFVVTGDGVVYASEYRIRNW